MWGEPPETDDVERPELDRVVLLDERGKVMLQIGGRTRTDMFNTLAVKCDLFPLMKCWNDFGAAGYV